MDFIQERWPINHFRNQDGPRYSAGDLWRQILLYATTVVSTLGIDRRETRLVLPYCRMFGDDGYHAQYERSCMVEHIA